MQNQTSRSPRTRLTASRTAAALLGATVAAGTTALVIAPAGNAATAATVLRFSNTMDGPPTQVDLGAPGLTVGDAYYISSTMRGPLSGRTAASCVVTSLAGGGVQQCSIDFLAGRGTISTHGTTDTAHTVVRLVVVGGTGAYAGRSGSGTLTPTPTGSDVVLSLR